MDPVSSVGWDPVRTEPLIKRVRNVKKVSTADEESCREGKTERLQIQLNHEVHKCFIG